MRDNGVGDQRYAGKLFGLFQRLHANEEFEATASACSRGERIIQWRGGRDWPEGKKGKGAIFSFTLRGEES